jgi:hypothetical protein
MTDLRPDHLRELIEPLGMDPIEANRLVRLMTVVAGLPPPPDPVGLYPAYEEHRAAFLAAAAGDDGEALEEMFLALYCSLHGHEAPYSKAERRRVTVTGGYWAHAGGLSPVLKAGPLIGPASVVGDFGAGNGLQGLLMQVLDPHALTIQIEISGRMVEAGRALQRWLEIPEERVRWVVGDVIETSPVGMDLIYLYRPVRPVGEGRKFYEHFAAELGSTRDPVVILSVADCLSEFLPEDFTVFYGDGHLTCYRR